MKRDRLEKIMKRNRRALTVDIVLAAAMLVGLGTSSAALIAHVGAPAPSATASGEHQPGADRDLAPSRDLPDPRG